MEQEFKIFIQDNRLSENTANSYVSDIKLYKKYYEDTYGETLETLFHADIIMYRTYLYNNNFSAITINRKLAALKMYNQFLVEKKIQDNIVIGDKDYIKIQKTIINKQLPSMQEINRLIHHACKSQKNSKRDSCLLSIFIYGGLRESEIVSIRINDIHLKDRYINVFGKGNKFRQVVINNYMYNALEDYLQERTSIEIDSPYLFISQKSKNNNGKPFNRNFCNRLLSKYKELCNIKELHPHLLRAYYCSNALHNAGYSIDQVANQAGHSSLNTTKGYLISEQESIINLANKL